VKLLYGCCCGARFASSLPKLSCLGLQARLLLKCVLTRPLLRLGYMAAGNAAVLRARFEDATFFYEEDLKQPLEAFR